MITEWQPAGALAVVLGIAVGHDIWARRIPNWLVVLALVAAVVVNVLSAANAWSGLGKALFGAITGLAVMLPLYSLRAMGAGDAKLMAAVGAFLGPIQALGAALLAFIAGGILSMAAAFCSGTVRRVADNLRAMSLLAMTGRDGSSESVRTTGRLPYALAIAAGTALQIWSATQASWPFK